MFPDLVNCPLGHRMSPGGNHSSTGPGHLGQEPSRALGGGSNGGTQVLGLSPPCPAQARIEELEEELEAERTARAKVEKPHGPFLGSQPLGSELNFILH